MGCHNDALAMERIAKEEGFKTVPLLSADATRERVIQEIHIAKDELYPGDFFLLTYSGHGGQLPDLDGDEADKYDETWCLYNGEFIDDELYALLKLFPQWTRILVVSDSCHSGTVIKSRWYAGEHAPFKAMPRPIAQDTYQAHKDFYDRIRDAQDQSKAKYDFPARAILLGGCQDNQYSSDGEDNGLFTEKLLQVWDNGKFQGDYFAFHKQIGKLMPPSQTPSLVMAGRLNRWFQWSRPFVL